MSTHEDAARRLVDAIQLADQSNEHYVAIVADAIREAENAAIEAAAKLADPPLVHRKGSLGLWRIRRIEIAERIRALKSKV